MKVRNKGSNMKQRTKARNTTYKSKTRTREHKTTASKQGRSVMHAKSKSGKQVTSSPHYINLLSLPAECLAIKPYEGWRQEGKEEEEEENCSLND